MKEDRKKDEKERKSKGNKERKNEGNKESIKEWFIVKRKQKCKKK